MKIILYSDLHLEFSNPFKPPKGSDADLMILAGDIITFTHDGFQMLKKFLDGWDKPVLFVAGNHEYYTKKCMQECSENFSKFIAENLPNLTWLRDQAFEFGGVHFFGGTMWTDFDKADPLAMMFASMKMNDYRLIRRSGSYKLRPEDTTKMHNAFVVDLVNWFEATEGKKRVVISHHAPCLNPNSNFRDSKVWGAYNSLDMVPLIERYQPALWCYGHTHEADDQMIGNTRIVSNPFGYYYHDECRGFDENGLQIVL